jgi:hypothetical protein
MRYSRDEQEESYGYSKRELIEKLRVGLERAGGNIKIQVIGKDRVSGVIADQDHEDALDQVQESHNQVEAPQSGKLAIRCAC